MSRFLIEVPHEAGMAACARAVEALLKSGSHFLTHADWGCKDGVHKAWVTVEVQDRNEARGIVPPEFRTRATVIELNTFTVAEAEHMLRQQESK